MMFPPLPSTATPQERQDRYALVQQGIRAVLEDERDWIAALATVACELHHNFEAFHWTGFYRAVSADLLKVGPYQGGHGCLEIPFEHGVCGAAARTKSTQLVDDVRTFEGHIACSTTTISEVVVPILAPNDVLLGVLDVDSDLPAAFDALDQRWLEAICRDLGQRFGDLPEQRR